LIQDIAKFDLGDNDYIKLYLSYYPLLNDCFYLQTSNESALSVKTLTVQKPSAWRTQKLEAIPEEAEASGAESKPST
jgi:hypothetical protein